MKHLSTFLILILFNFIFACGVTQVGGKNRCKYANDKDACLKALNDIKAGKNQPKNDKDEICDSKDNDEDGKIDEDFKLGTACEVQKEGCLGSLKGTRVCSADQEKAVCKYEKSLNPEKCDGIDNNCDGDIDEGFGLGELCSKKENGEGGITCNIPGKKVCSDNDPDKAICQLDKSLGELCDGLDNDCDNKVDEGFKDLNSKCEYVNGTCKADGQNICSKDKKSVECGLDPSWLSSNPELCDGKDNNCDGKIDEGFKIGQSCSVNSSIDKTLCKGTFTCSSGQGATTAICEQTKEDSNKETCDQKDNDCDGTIDEGVKTLFYVDKDGDGVGLASLTLEACNKPNGYALISGDCDDTKKEVYPKNKEVCDSLDNDCDKQTDEGVSITYYVDKDKDGYGHKGTTNFSCKAPSGFVSNADDCNDGDKNINPGATEICDSKDNDCDKKIDNIQSSITVYADNDKDGQGDPNNKKTIAVSGCPATIPTGFVNNKNDCFDGDNTVFKGADELCDSKDNDCDTKFDEGFEDKSKSCSKGVGACKGLGTYYCSPDKKSLLCSAPIVNSTDEYCGDKIDNDCDGKTDEGFLDFNKTCTEGKGKCQATGTNMCSPDRKSLKCSAIPSPAQKEMCDDFDHDCDGENYNGFNDYGSTCEVGKGICKKKGVFICKSDGSGVICNVTAGQAASKEICGNGLDDNCDGKVDENCSSDNPSALGPYKPGTLKYNSSNKTYEYIEAGSAAAPANINIELKYIRFDKTEQQRHCSKYKDKDACDGAISNRKCLCQNVDLEYNLYFPYDSQKKNVASSNKKYPVIIFSSSYTVNGDWNKNRKFTAYHYLLRHLASHGFMVFALSTERYQANTDNKEKEIVAALQYLEYLSSIPTSNIGKNTDISKVLLIGHLSGGETILKQMYKNQNANMSHYDAGLTLSVNAGGFNTNMLKKIMRPLVFLDTKNTSLKWGSQHHSEAYYKSYKSFRSAYIKFQLDSHHSCFASDGNCNPLKNNTSDYTLFQTLVKKYVTAWAKYTLLREAKKMKPYFDGNEIDKDEKNKYLEYESRKF